VRQEVYTTPDGWDWDEDEDLSLLDSQDTGRESVVPRLLDFTVLLVLYCVIPFWLFMFFAFLWLVERPDTHEANPKA
jgi:hypothetical protein